MQTMIRKISSLLIAAMALMSFASCMSDDDDDDTTYYDDTAITSFSLGTLKQKVVTKAADGVTDSTFTTTFSGSKYRFNIDQVAGTIYNNDSLPYGTDASHVLATITALNSGVVAIVNPSTTGGEDTVRYYISNDSIDFSSRVILRVYNMRATAYKDYTVNVNIHKQDGNAFNWNTTTGDFANVSGKKIVTLGSDVFLFGEENGQTVGFRKDGDAWQAVSSISDANAYKNMTVFNGYLYTIANNNISRSQDGESWETVAPAEGINAIAGASSSKLYAITDNGISYSTDGKTWTADNIDDSASLLPNEDINFISKVSITDDNVNRLNIIGNRDGKTVIWSKVEENDNASSTEPWAFYSLDEYNRKTLPYLQNLQVVAYDNGLLATGGDMTKFYYSPDQGLTWDVVSTYSLPQGFTGTATPFSLACDADNFLYLSKANDNRVLTGRLARTAWKQQDSVTNN